MKGTPLLDAVLGGWLLAAIVWYVWMMCMGVLLPIAIVSAVRSLRGIRRELEALNARGGVERAGAPGRLIAP